MGNQWLYSCYLAPSLTISEFASVMEEIALDVRGKPQVIIAGDFNAWAEEWGSSRTNARGQTVLEALATLDLALMNHGSQHTFTRAGTGSVIDLAFVSYPIARSAKWAISNVYTASDHRAITIDLDHTESPRANGLQGGKAYKVDTLDPEAFAGSFAVPNWSDNAEVSAELLMRSITDACDASMAVRRSCKIHHVPVYWWNQQIADVRRRLPREKGVLNGIVDALFTGSFTVPSVEDHVEHRLYTEVPEVTVEEVMLAAARNQGLQVTWAGRDPKLRAEDGDQAPSAVLYRNFGQCMRQGVFPRPWKLQNLVLIPKPNKPLDSPSSYRPICLLDTTGKILRGCSQVTDIARRAIAGRRWRGDAKEYCIVMTLDVKNAFNSANWSCIIGALRRFNTPSYLMEIIEDYFRKRILRYRTDNGTKSFNITGGVPQGSVLGPLLWNIMYDGILRLDVPESATIVGFADDVALVVTAK
ncbi:uncharacterized protein LOC132798010 [Drosophila nasuta]|uniref:uncharacterized protein LOC132798010 n=1 Tax=Drosophila nasuta TaxID=42062 RepID=UPI00295E6DDA|nr:uncharacterized protein LOC132798010 [Drosophila nasuta]